MTSVDFLTVSKWDSAALTAEGEYDPCEKNLYIINRKDHSVLLISSPGKSAEGRGCKGILGEPKTVTYKLSQ